MRQKVFDTCFLHSHRPVPVPTGSVVSDHSGPKQKWLLPYPPIPTQLRPTHCQSHPIMSCERGTSWPVCKAWGKLETRKMNAKAMGGIVFLVKCQGRDCSYLSFAKKYKTISCHHNLLRRCLNINDTTGISP